MSETKAMTDSEIVAALRGHDGEKRQRALEAIYRENPALLIEVRPDATQTSMVSVLDLDHCARMHVAVEGVLGNITSATGVRLLWVTVADMQRQAEPKIEVAQALDPVGAALSKRGRGFG